MTKAEFKDAIRYVKNPSKKTLDIAYATLVEKQKQTEVAEKYGVSQGAISQATERLWKGFLKSKGYEKVSVVLHKHQAFTVKKLAKEAAYILNKEK